MKFREICSARGESPTVNHATMNNKAKLCFICILTKLYIMEEYVNIRSNLAEVCIYRWTVLHGRFTCFCLFT